MSATNAPKASFGYDDLMALNVILAIVMYGIALELRRAHFHALLKNPRASFTGLSSQLLLLPLITYALVWAMAPKPVLALGMFMVAACPGGNISNFMSFTAKGNTALSVALSGVTSVTAIIMTPLIFTILSLNYPPTAQYLAELFPKAEGNVNLVVDPVEVGKVMFIILALPIALGLATVRYLPKLAQKLARPLKYFSMIIFVALVFVMVRKNYDSLSTHLDTFIVLVIVHNFLALLGGYLFATAMRLPEADRRTVTIETGIQNSGLALILTFAFFNTEGGMKLIAAGWGIWHIVSGLTLANIWSRRPI